MADTHLQRPASPMSALAWGALAIGSIASVVFGVLLAIWPKESLIALVWIFGVFAVVFGVMQLVLAYRVRRMDVA